MITFVKVIVNDDEKKAANFNDSLDKFAASELSKELAKIQEARIINIEETSWVDEMKPRLDNSGTWYDRTSVLLKAWIEVSDKTTK